jgi:Flp pilus assembly CpaE family ATPase
MNAGWLIANNCYAVFAEGNIVPINGKRFFNTLKELRDHLRPLGLTLNKKKKLIKLEEGSVCRKARR